MLPYNYTMQPQFAQPNAFTQPTQAPLQAIQYVNGLESANAYRMQPNSEVILMDSNNPVFYFKKTDASGFSTVKAYEFHEVEDKKTDYVTKQEFEEFVSKIENRFQHRNKEVTK